MFENNNLLKLIKKNWKMLTRAQLDLETLGAPPLKPKKTQGLGGEEN